MLTTTIRDFLTNDWSNAPRTGRERLYVVRNEADVFYVGKSAEISMRLAQHFGLGPYPKDASRLGRYMYVNLPESLNWQIDLLTCEDVKALTGEENLGDHAYAEYSLIAYHQPFLNENAVVRARAIPSIYKRPPDETDAMIDRLEAALEGKWAK